MPKLKIGVLLIACFSLVVSLSVRKAFAQDALRTIDVPNAIETDCNDINKTGVIAGFSADNNGVQTGLALVGSSFKKINKPGSTGTLAYGINDHNLVTGWYFDSTGNQHGYALQGTTFQTIDVPQST